MLKLENRVLAICVFFAAGLAFSGQDLSRNEMISHSDLIFVGHPTQDKAVGKCPTEISRWKIDQVFKGDSTLVGKVISIAQYGYRVTDKAPSKYAALTYGIGKLDEEKSPAVLFVSQSAR